MADGQAARGTDGRDITLAFQEAWQSNAPGVGPDRPYRSLSRQLNRFGTLISGSLAILVIGQLILGLGDLGEVLLKGEWGQIGESLLAHIQAPDFWLWLYLIFAVSNAMLPSETDRESWRPVLLFACLAVLFFYLTGWVRQVPEVLANASLTSASYLAYAFSLTAVADAIFIAIIAIFEALVSRLTGKRVEY